MISKLWMAFVIYIYIFKLGEYFQIWCCFHDSQHMFYSILGCVLPLQEVALRQSLPSFSVLCYPRPYRSLLPHNVISPTMFWSSDWSYTSVCHCVLLTVHLYHLLFGRCVQPISISYWLCIGQPTCVTYYLQNSIRISMHVLMSVRLNTLFQSEISNMCC